MSSIDVPPRPSSSAYWSPPAVPHVLAAVSDGRQPPQSAGRGFRVLHALLRLGADQEHQLADIARAADLQPSHASKLLKAAALERLVEHGTRRGTYRLTRDAAPLTPNPTGTAAVTAPVRRIVEDLRQETGLAVAWHEPHFKLGLGLHLTLVDLACPHPELRTAAAQQDDDPRATAAGRAALAYVPAELAAGADDRPLVLPAATRDTIRSTRIALRRCPGICTLATPVLRGQHPVAVLSLTGADPLFREPLRAQEFAVLLRRAATRAAGPCHRPEPAPARRIA
jgi:DNA-binding IclR family transcriptional regulator